MPKFHEKLLNFTNFGKIPPKTHFEKKIFFNFLSIFERKKKQYPVEVKKSNATIFKNSNPYFCLCKIRCWDLKAGKSSSVLTHHKKSVRSLYCHPTEYTFASGSGDNIKVWKCPEGRFLRNFEKRPPSITNDLVINNRNICVSGHDTGQIYFWDWKVMVFFHLNIDF